MLPREAALRILTDKRGSSRGFYLSKLSKASDRALAERLVNGTTKWQGLLDYYLESFSSRSVNTLTPRVLAALRIGAYQMLLMGAPPYASVSTAVDCLKSRGERAFVNAVLRSVSRSLGHVELPSPDDNPVSYAAIRFSYPEWISRVFIEKFGLEAAFRLCDFGNEAPPLVLRANRSLTSVESFIARLERAGIGARPGRIPGSVVLTRGHEVSGLPGFAEGEFLVQDEAAQIVSMVVAARPYEAVWDACAAPGGKTEHLAEMMDGKGILVATDISQDRVKMVRETVGRMGFPFVTVLHADAARGPGHSLAGGGDLLFDRILVDAPCSGLGVIRRNADLRWNRREADIPGMASRQKELLKAAVRHLKPGGVIVYSTCTLTAEENELVWAEFLHTAHDMVPEDPASAVPEGVAALFSGEPFAGQGYRYLLPQDAGTDGFFIARARRES